MWWSPYTNWLPSSLTVQEIITQYIVLDGDWVGEREGVAVGVVIVCISQAKPYSRFQYLTCTC